MIAMVRYQLSADDNEMAGTTSRAGHADQVTVWTRTGGTKVADNLFAGEWSQDMSKTRLRQGLVLRIEAEGTEGSVSRAISATRPVSTAKNTI